MTSDSDGKTRRRGEVLTDAILDAALQELAETGWANLSLASVATRAGTGNSSVYSRWPTKASLIRAATNRLAQLSPEPGGFSGDLVEDLLAIARATAMSLEGPVGQALRGFVAERGSGPDVQAGPSIFDDSAPVQAVAEVVSRAQAAGVLPQKAQAPRVLNLGLTLIGHHFLLNGAPPSDDAVVEIVMDVWLPLLRR